MNAPDTADAALTMAAWSRRIAARNPQRPAIVEGARGATFAELDARTERLAAALVAAGIAPGDRVAVLLLNGLPLIELYLAAAKARAILLPLNWRLAAPELGWIIGDAAPGLLFVSEGLAALAAAIASPVRTIMVADGPRQGDGYEAFLEGGAGPLPQALPDDPWFMLYTSGTTGRPKGCLLDQRGQAIGALSMASLWRLDTRDRLLVSLPLFHVGGTGVLFASLTAGATILIAPRTFDGADAYRFIVEHECTAAAVVPQLYAKLIELHRANPKPLRLRLLTGGGGMHDPAFVAELCATLGTEMILGYGQTEAGNYIAYLHDWEQNARPKACGRVLPHLDVRVVDGEDRDVPPGQPGELLVRGPGVLQRYWNNAEATEKALAGGWLHTGDIVTLDDGGFITLVGRAKELIKTGGENVYPREVEAALLEHPAIVDCAVFGIDDPYWSECVKALVALAPGASLTPREVADWVRGRIAAYKRPRFVEFVAVMPRTDTGKLLTRELKARPVTPDQAVE